MSSRDAGRMLRLDYAPRSRHVEPANAPRRDGHAEGRHAPHGPDDAVALLYDASRVLEVVREGYVVLGHIEASFLIRITRSRMDPGLGRQGATCLRAIAITTRISSSLLATVSTTRRTGSPRFPATSPATGVRRARSPMTAGSSYGTGSRTSGVTPRGSLPKSRLRSRNVAASNEFTERESRPRRGDRRGSRPRVVRRIRWSS